jgi:hypothetical protein
VLALKFSDERLRVLFRMLHSLCFLLVNSHTLSIYYLR